MKRLESCTVALGSELKTALLLHLDTRAWHYGLNLLNNDHSSSLLTYLQLTRAEYEDVLVICGLAKKQKYKESTRFEILSVPWEEFLREIGICSNYFGKYHVSIIDKGKVWWIQLGGMDRTVQKTDQLDEMDQH